MSNLVEKLSMPHLSDLEESQKKAEAIVSPEKPVVDLKDPKLQKIYTFDFNWTDGRGKVWKGSFTNHILSIRETQVVGLMQAEMQKSFSYESIDPFTREINYILAHLAVSLDKENRPEWAKDLSSLNDTRLLQALYSEVAKHESMFLG